MCPFNSPNCNNDCQSCTDVALLVHAKQLKEKQSLAGKKRAASVTSEQQREFIKLRWARYRASGVAKAPRKRYRPKPKPITPPIVTPAAIVPPKPDVVTEIPTKLRVIRIIRE